MAFPGIYIDNGTVGSLLNYITADRQNSTERFKVRKMEALERERLRVEDENAKAAIAADVKAAELRHEQVMEANAINRLTAENTHKYNMGSLNESIRQFTLTYNASERAVGEKEKSDSILAAFDHLKMAGDGITALTAQARAQVIAANPEKYSNGHVPNEDIIKFMKSEKTYDPFEKAVAQYTQNLAIYSQGINEKVAGSVGESFVAMPASNPRVQELAEQAGIEIEPGTVLGVRVRRDENGRVIPVGIVQTSDGGVAATQDILQVFNAANVQAAGIGAQGPLARQELANQALNAAKTAQQAVERNELTAAEGAARLAQITQAVNGDAQAAQSYAQTLVDEATNPNAIHVSSQERLQQAVQRNVENASKRTPIIKPLGTPTRNNTLATDLNTLERFAMGTPQQSVAGAWDPVQQASYNSLQDRIQARADTGFAFTGIPGERDAATRYTQLLSAPNSEIVKSNLEISGAQDEALNTPGLGAANARVSGFINKWLEKHGKDGGFTEQQTNDIYKRIDKNYAKWAAEQGANPDMSKASKQDLSLMFQRAAMEHMRQNSSRLERAAPVVGESFSRAIRTLGELPLVPADIVTKVVTGREGVGSAIASSFREATSTLGRHEVPLSGTEAGDVRIGPDGQLVVVPGNRTEMLANQGAFIPQAVSLWDRERRQELNQNPGRMPGWNYPYGQ